MARPGKTNFPCTSAGGVERGQGTAALAGQRRCRTAAAECTAGCLRLKDKSRISGKDATHEKLLRVFPEAISPVGVQTLATASRRDTDETDGRLGNDKTFIVPTEDLSLLAILNSPLMWWFNWRHLTHLKDEALSPMGYKMERLPIAQFEPAAKEMAARLVGQMITEARCALPPPRSRTGCDTRSGSTSQAAHCLTSMR
jgi:hypothetical protein